MRALTLLLLCSPALAWAFPNAPAEQLARVDSDGDGKVSRAEFLTAHGEAMFTQLDGDRDGRVSPVEFRRRGW